MSTKPSRAGNGIKAAIPLLAVTVLLLSACPSIRWLDRSVTWDAEGREHNAGSVLAWVGEPDPAAVWPVGIVGLYMIEGYVREWPTDAPSQYQSEREYLAVMMLAYEDTDAEEMAAAALRECHRYDAQRTVPSPLLLMRGGDLRSHVYLCVTAELADALEQPEERARADEYLRRAGFRFTPAELTPERRLGF